MAQNLPEPMDPPRLVNDYVGILSDEEFRYLEHKLESYEDTTSNQIAIAIIRTTGGDDIALFSADLGEKWGIGQGNKNNGVLITVAIEDHDVFISIGYGLEGAITDAASKRIVENYLLPNFRNQDYFRGLDEATSLLIGLAEGEFSADEMAATAETPDPVAEIIGLLITAMIFILPMYFINRHRAKNHYGTTSPSMWMIMALMMSGRRSGRAGSSFNDFSGGGGGGFGGFGGGGFGGGGAGGSW